mmetsp:Transcript_26942/g.45821  ORF Transcript_26942/g.45821 Transcript_26942/m.45821 type:complete len:91 (-) Transcript_26942:598-870(-)
MLLLYSFFLTTTSSSSNFKMDFGGQADLAQHAHTSLYNVGAVDEYADEYADIICDFGLRERERHLSSAKFDLSRSRNRQQVEALYMASHR